MRIVIFGSTLVGVMGVAILSPAFPEVQDALNINEFQVGLLITAFTLPGIFFAPLMGYLADKFGRREILTFSLLTFGFSGFLCPFVDYKAMLILRFLQGVGGSALTSLAVTLIGDLFDGIERVKMLGYNASILSIGLALYPLLGGFLAEIDWRLPFFSFLISIPIGILSIKLTSVRTSRKFKVELSGELFMAFVLGCIVFIMTYGVFYLHIPMTLEEKFQAGPILRGFVQSSTLLITAIVASNIGTFVSRLGTRKTISLGFFSYGTSLALIPLSPNVAVFTVSTMIYGLGHGTVLPALQNLIVERTSVESRATIMTIYGSMIRIGQTIGPILTTSIGNSYLFASILAFLLSVVTFKTNSQHL